MKIRIIGPVGSGKTQLAKKLGLKYGISVTSLDDLNWRRKPTGDIHRTPEEREILINKILKQTDWIVEGVQYRYGQETFTDADIIYFKDIPHLRNLYYLTKRYLKNHLAKNTNQYSRLSPYLKWERSFRNNERAEIWALLRRYANKVVILKK